MAYINPNRICIIDHVGSKAGMNAYSDSLAAVLASRGFLVNVYSNFTGHQQKVVYRKYFSRRSKFSIVTAICFYVAALRLSFLAARNNSANFIFHVFTFSFHEWFIIRLVRLFSSNIFLIIHDLESLRGKQTKLRFGKSILRNSSCVIVHNQFSKSELLSKFSVNQKVHVIPHGNYIRYLERLATNWVKQTQFHESGFVRLLFFGQLKQSKGLDILIKALYGMPADVHLIIAGRPRDSSWKEIKKMSEDLHLNDRIEWRLKHVPDSEAIELFNQADIVVLPYRKIYQSGVLLYAWSLKKPVIVSNLSSNCELVDHEVNGLVFESENENDLAIQAIRMINDKEFSRKLAANGFDSACNQHSWEKIGGLWTELLIR